MLIYINVFQTFSKSRTGKAICHVGTRLLFPSVTAKCSGSRPIKTSNHSSNYPHHRPAQRGAYNLESCPRSTLSLPTSLATYSGCNLKTLSSSVRTGFSYVLKNSGRGQETRCSNVVCPRFTSCHPSFIWTRPLISDLVIPPPPPSLRSLRLSPSVVHPRSMRVTRTVRLGPSMSQEMHSCL